MSAPKALLFAGVLIAVVPTLVLVAAGWWYMGTPQHSLALLADAVKAKDYETARDFVDDERIADTTSKSVLDAAMTRFTKEMKADENPLSGIGVGVFQMMAPTLRETVKGQVKDSIRQALSGDSTLTNRLGAQELNVNLLSQMRIENCAVSGKTAEVLIRGIPQPNPAQISEIHLRMARIPSSRRWRIEEIPELAQAYLKVLDSEKAPEQANKEAANVSESAAPAVTVSKPNRVLEQFTESICRIDFRNSRIFLGKTYSGDDWTVLLADGTYEKDEDPGTERVDLKNVFCFDGGIGGREYALVITEWRTCGADCQMGGVVQVMELRNSRPVITQQIEFDSKAQRTGATFDAHSLSLTVIGRSRHEEDEAECCPKNLDVVAYRWDGEQFVQSSYKRVPVPPS